MVNVDVYENAEKPRQDLSANGLEIFRERVFYGNREIN